MGGRPWAFPGLPREEQTLLLAYRHALLSRRQREAQGRARGRGKPHLEDLRLLSVGPASLGDLAHLRAMTRPVSKEATGGASGMLGLMMAREHLRRRREERANG